MKKSKFNIGDRVRLSNFDSPSKKGYKHQFTQELFEIFAISSRKPPTNTIKDEMNRTRLSVVIFSKSSKFCNLEPGFCLSIADIVEAMKLLIQKLHITAWNVSQLKCLEEPKKFSFTSKMKNLVWRSLLWTWDTILVAMLALNFESSGKRPHKPNFAYDIVRILSLMINADLIEYNTVDDKKAP